MKKVIKTFWGDVEIVEISTKRCKAILNGETICEMNCSIKLSEEKLAKKLYSTLDKMKENSFFN